MTAAHTVSVLPFQVSAPPPETPHRAGNSWKLIQPFQKSIDEDIPTIFEKLNIKRGLLNMNMMKETQSKKVINWRKTWLRKWHSYCSWRGVVLTRIVIQFCNQVLLLEELLRLRFVGHCTHEVIRVFNNFMLYQSKSEVCLQFVKSWFGTNTWEEIQRTPYEGLYLGYWRKTGLDAQNMMNCVMNREL